MQRLVHPTLIAFDRRWSSFKVLGCLGAVLGALLGALLAHRRGLALWVVATMTAVSLAAAVVQFALAWKLGGSRRLVYYRYEITIVLVLTGLLRLLDQPVLAYLDIAILGIGTFLVAGRLGCFMVGCCHGIPHELGVHYGASHVARGFAPYLVHVRLLPVQLIEAGGAAVLVVAGVIAVARGSDPGWVFAAWVVSYGAGRFHLERLRGDAARGDIAGFSEAQWTSLVVMVASVAAGASGLVPLHAWHVALASLVGLEMLAIAGLRRLRGTGVHLLSHPRHLDQLARLVVDLGAIASSRGAVVGTTSLGIRVSLSRSERDGEPPRFTLSRDGAPLPEPDARTLARWLARFGGFAGVPWLELRDSGVVHVGFSSPRPTQRDTSLR